MWYKIYVIYDIFILCSYYMVFLEFMLFYDILIHHRTIIQIPLPFIFIKDVTQITHNLATCHHASQFPRGFLNFSSHRYNWYSEINIPFLSLCSQPLIIFTYHNNITTVWKIFTLYYRRIRNIQKYLIVFQTQKPQVLRFNILRSKNRPATIKNFFLIIHQSFKNRSNRSFIFSFPLSCTRNTLTRIVIIKISFGSYVFGHENISRAL